MKNPIQPLIEGRFKKNTIVEYLLDFAANYGCGMNQLAMQDFTADDRQQFAQLIGYSLDGYGTLSYVDDEAFELARAQLEPVPPAGDVEVRDAFCAAYRGLKGYAPLRVEGTDQYTFFAAGFEVQSTRLTAERDDWKARCARRVEDIQLQAERHEQTQFELTKARELLNELVTCSPSEVWAVMDKARAYLAHQSARAKPEGGEE